MISTDINGNANKCFFCFIVGCDIVEATSLENFPSLNSVTHSVDPENHANNLNSSYSNQIESFADHVDRNKSSISKKIDANSGMILL